MSGVPYVRLPVELPASYEHGPDSFAQPGVPRGELHERQTAHGRRYWIHVPAHYDDREPAALMVFQDAEWYLDLERHTRAPIVFDNLIHRGEMPVTIGLYVEPAADRNAEYDAFDDAYARFLLDEIVPAVRGELAVSDDPERWAVGGGSSGGVCAFTVGWLRPDRFRKVLSFVGSFAQVPGGNPYPALIRTTEPKPLRIFLQTVSRDLGWNEPEGNFVSENLQVAAALAERGYDFRLVFGDGDHPGNHSGVILPDALRWLWRD